MGVLQLLPLQVGLTFLSVFSFPYSIINDDFVPETLSKQEDKLGTDIPSDKDNFFCDKILQERL